MASSTDPPPDDPRTVFSPSASGRPQPEPEAVGPTGDGGETVFSPRSSAPGGAARAGGPAAPNGGQVGIGMVLNGMFRVKRFHARGGMAEIYEGVNVNDEADR